MDDDTQITATRAELVAAFTAWDAQAEAENWPETHDAEASADHLITIIRAART